MRVIIAGSSSIRDPALVARAVEESGFAPSTVISGAQKSYDPVTRTYFGADYLGERWAEARNIPIERFPALWRYGKGAGMHRNSSMVARAHALIAIWDGSSPGTRDVLAKARAAELQVFVLRT